MVACKTIFIAWCYIVVVGYVRCVNIFGVNERGERGDREVVCRPGVMCGKDRSVDGIWMGYWGTCVWRVGFFGPIIPVSVSVASREVESQ